MWLASFHLHHFYTGLTWLTPVEFSIMPDTTEVLLAAALEFLLTAWNCFWANNILFLLSPFEIKCSLCRKPWCPVETECSNTKMIWLFTYKF